MKERAAARGFVTSTRETENMPATGARPAGAADEAGAAQAVRQMFDSIAPRYDLLNHLLSANVDRLWWRRTARRFRDVLARPEAAILDICCGTGDLTMALLKLRPPGARPVLAARLCARHAAPRSAEIRRTGLAQAGGSGKIAAPYAVPLEADALHLPLRAESLDLIVTAFGFRNLANYEAGLKEFHRTLKPGGQLGILEFSEPGGLDGQGLCALLPPRAAGHRQTDLRQGWSLQLPANLGRRVSRRPARCWQMMRSSGLCGLRLAALHLRHCRVVHGHAAPGSLRTAMTSAVSSSRIHRASRSEPRRSREKRRVALLSMAAAAVMTLLKLGAGLLSGLWACSRTQRTRASIWPARRSLSSQST